MVYIQETWLFVHGTSEREIKHTFFLPFFISNTNKLCFKISNTPRVKFKYVRRAKYVIQAVNYILFF